MGARCMYVRALDEILRGVVLRLVPLGVVIPPRSLPLGVSTGYQPASFVSKLGRSGVVPDPAYNFFVDGLDSV